MKHFKYPPAFFADFTTFSIRVTNRLLQKCINHVLFKLITIKHNKSLALPLLLIVVSLLITSPGHSQLNKKQFNTVLSAKQIFESIPNKEITSVTSAVFFKTKVEFIKEIENQKEWLLKYISSDMYRKRLLSELERDQPFENFETYNILAQKMVAERKTNLIFGKYEIQHDLFEIDQITVLGSYAPKQDVKLFSETDKVDSFKEDNRAGLSLGNINFTYIEGSLYSFLTQSSISQGTIPVHEFSHQSTDGNALLLKNTKREINRLVNKDSGNYTFYTFFKDKESGVIYSYLDDPTEVKARIDALRYLLNRYKIYNAGTEKFKEKHFRKLIRVKEIRNDSSVKDVFELILKDKKSLFLLMNSIAKINCKLINEITILDNS